jgi:IS5 family transposase
MPFSDFPALTRRYERLDQTPDPLAVLNRLIPWETFQPRLRAALEAAGARTRPEARKSAAGRPPWDEILMFKVLVLQALYNLSDDRVEHLILDRLSFMRFLGLGLDDRVPDARTVWLYREALAETGATEALFDAFDTYLHQNGYRAMGGQIIDATLVPAPVNHNTKEENDVIKAGGVPEAWKKNPAKLRQKDLDARWTKKNEQSYHGYKNHINVDRRHELIRRYTVTNAAPHDSREFDTVLDADNTARDIWADSAYRSAETEARLSEQHHRSRIHRRPWRNRPLTEREKRGNTTRSRVRARVEHVFGHMVTSMGGKLVRTMGMVRAKVKIGMRNLTYNPQRFVCLARRVETGV